MTTSARSTSRARNRSEELDDGQTGDTGSFNNEGTFIVDSPLDATVANPVGEPIAFYAVAFNNDGGSVQVQQGTLLLDGGGDSTNGSFNVSSGATLQVGEDYDLPYTFGAATTLSGAGSFTVADDYISSLNLDQGQQVNGSKVIFAGNSTLSGPLTVSSGTVQFDGSQPSSAVAEAPQIYAKGVTLSGSGTVGPITTASSMTVGSPPYAVTTTDSNISPGDGTTEPGILTVDGDVTLNSVTNFDVALNGATAAHGYDQLNPTGSVNLGGCNLDATLGFTPVAGNSFTIIKSSTPITGTFNGLPEGGTVKIGGVSFTITYKGGASGDDVVLTPSVATTTPTGTTTSLESSANPSTLDQTVTFTAIVAPASGNSSPTGNVTFTIDGQAQTPVALAVVSGVDQATFTTSTLTNGPHTISVAYAGNASFAPSAPSSPLTQTVDAPTTIMLSSSSNPSLLGQSVTFTATVTVSSGTGVPTGSVSFSEGGTVLSTSPLDSAGKATFTTSALATGSDLIAASYTPTGDFLDSPPQTVTQTVSAAPLETTATQLTSSANPSTLGQSVTFTAVVTTTGSGTPGGHVTFTIDGKAQTAVALTVASGVDEATLSTAALSVGQHAVSAVYVPLGNFVGSPSNNLTQVVNAAPLASTATKLSSSANPATVGQAVTFTAVVTSVAAGTPGGNVTFTIDGQCSARPANGGWRRGGGDYHDFVLERG